MKLNNGQYSLAALQMAYLGAKLEKEGREDNGCNYCWGTGCDCNSESIETDPFLNMTEELIYA